MREVAVTEGDKVSAQYKFGYSVNGYGIGALVQCINGISEKKIDCLIDTLPAYGQLGGSGPLAFGITIDALVH